MTEAAQKKESPEDMHNPEVQPAEAQAPDPAAQLKEAEAEILKLKDMYLRAMAETENVRARAKRESEETAKYATTKFARDMVNIVENIVRASQSIPAQARAENEMLKSVGDGLDMTQQELLGIFERNGIRRLNPLGEKFDHNLHQAVSQVESLEAQPGMVAQVLQAGYVLHDRLLRPAMVIVTTAGVTASGSASDAS